MEKVVGSEAKMTDKFSVSKVTKLFAGLSAADDAGASLAIDTDAFLTACASIPPIFDILGTAFYPVKSDMDGNIEKLRKHMLADPASGATLEGLIQKEVAASSTKASGSATDALLWLKRGLEFILYFVKEFAANGQKDLPTAVQAAYDNVLSPFHGFFVRGVFKVALYAVPDLDVFLSYCEGDASDVVNQWKEFIDVFAKIVEPITVYYEKQNLNDKSKV